MAAVGKECLKCRVGTPQTAAECAGGRAGGQ